MSEMDACQAVEKEIDKVIQKFTAIQSHSGKVFDDVLGFIQQLQASIAEGKVSLFFRGEVQFWRPLSIRSVCCCVPQSNVGQG